MDALYSEEVAQAPRLQPPNLAACLGDKVGLWLRLAQRNFTQCVDQRFRVHAVNHNDYMALNLIRAFPGVNLTILGRQLGAKPPNISSMIDYLAHKGFVRRETNECDKRALDLYLTPSGAALMGQLDVIHASLIREAFGSHEAKGDVIDLIKALQDITLMGGVREKIAAAEQARLAAGG